MLEHEQRQLESAGDSKFAKNSGQMRLDRPLGDEQLLGDLLVAGARTQKLGDLPFPRGNAVEAIVDVHRGLLRRTLGERGQLFEKVRNELAPHPDLSLLDDVEGLEQQGRIDVAVAVSSGARLERGDRKSVV